MEISGMVPAGSWGEVRGDMNVPDFSGEVLPQDRVTLGQYEGVPGGNAMFKSISARSFNLSSEELFMAKVGASPVAGFPTPEGILKGMSFDPFSFYTNR